MSLLYRKLVQKVHSDNDSECLLVCHEDWPHNRAHLLDDVIEEVLVHIACVQHNSMASCTKVWCKFLSYPFNTQTPESKQNIARNGLSSFLRIVRLLDSLVRVWWRSLLTLPALDWASCLERKSHLWHSWLPAPAHSHPQSLSKHPWRPGLGMYKLWWRWWWRRGAGEGSWSRSHLKTSTVTQAELDMHMLLDGQVFCGQHEV